MLKKIAIHTYFEYIVKKKVANMRDISELNHPPKVILVISNTALGDTLLSTPAITSLKMSFPDSKIIALINNNYIGIFEKHAAIDEVIPFYGGYKKFFLTLKRIKNHHPQLSLIFHANAPIDIFYSILAGCKFILKHPTKSPFKKYLSYNFEKKRQHTIEDRLDLIRKVGATCITTQMTIASLDNDNLKSKYQKYHDTIALQLGAANIYKMWPVSHFIKLVQHILLTEPTKKIVITGVQNEYTLGKQIYDKFPNNVNNLCGKTPISELPYLINSVKLLITNDTGTMHLAIATRTPTLSLFSPTTSFGIGPYQDLNIHSVIQKDGSYMQKIPKKQRTDEAMKLITVEEVFAKYQKMNG